MNFHPPQAPPFRAALQRPVAALARPSRWRLPSSPTCRLWMVRLRQGPATITQRRVVPPLGPAMSTHLDQYIDSVADVPHELKRLFGTIRELDKVRPRAAARWRSPADRATPQTATHLSHEIDNLQGEHVEAVKAKVMQVRARRGAARLRPTPLPPLCAAHRLRAAPTCQNWRMIARRSRKSRRNAPNW